MLGRHSLLSPFIPSTAITTVKMTDDWEDEENHRLLDDDWSESTQFTSSLPKRKLHFTHIWAIISVLVASVLIVVLVALLFINANAEAAFNVPKQIAIPLRPERHVSRAPTTIEYHWNITLGVRYPDGVKKDVYLVNGKPLSCDLEPTHTNLAHRSVPRSYNRSSSWR